MRGLLLFAAALLATSAAQAECACRCVNGEVRPICTSAMDLPPLCAPTLCPLTPPSLAPLQPMQLPPLGTQSCRQVQVLNPRTGQYQWRTVCQ